jgi:hypothetical protein
MPNASHRFSNDPAYKKLKTQQLKKWNDSHTPDQWELRNAQQAVNYRNANAARLFDLTTYSGKREAKKWVQVARDRLAKAEAIAKPS